MRGYGDSDDEDAAARKGAEATAREWEERALDAEAEAHRWEGQASNAAAEAAAARQEQDAAEQALVLAVPLIERGATALVEAFAPQLPARVVPQLSALHDPRKPAFDSEGAICEDKKGAAYLYSQYHSLLRLSRLVLNHILHSELTTLFQLSSLP